MPSPNYNRLEKLLRPVGQMHLLRFWPQLEAAGRERLSRELEAVDWQMIPEMRKILQSSNPVSGADSTPAPVTHLSAAASRRAQAEGAAALAANKVAALLVAGGQGSRLGFEGPKGMFPIGPVSGASLFEIHARKILALEHRYQSEIFFMIMTSPANDAATREFFESRDYFGLTPSRVRFFVQGMLPAMRSDGTLILEAPDRLFLAPDGHGGTLAAFAKAGLPAELSARGVETVFYFQVDNPMVRICDPEFIGRHRRQGARMSLKVCLKRTPDEGLGIVAVRDDRTVIVEYTELSEAQKNARRPDGGLLFGYGSVAIHAFELDFMARQASRNLPLHRAFKKIPVCEDDGRTVTPDAPNAFKFERFIFDALPLADSVVLHPFERQAEFAPVKNASGADSPATARAALVHESARVLEAAGVAVPRDRAGRPLFAIEIDPLLDGDGAALRRCLGANPHIDRNVYLHPDSRERP